jgi:hypothetical protein
MVISPLLLEVVLFFDICQSKFGANQFIFGAPDVTLSSDVTATFTRNKYFVYKWFVDPVGVDAVSSLLILLSNLLLCLPSSKRHYPLAACSRLVLQKKAKSDGDVYSLAARGVLERRVE